MRSLIANSKVHKLALWHQRIHKASLVNRPLVNCWFGCWFGSWFTPRYTPVLVIASIFLVNACTSAPSQELVQDLTQEVDQSEMNWLDRREAAINRRYSSPDTKNPSGTNSKKLPAHNLMTKPVAEGRLTSGHGYRLDPFGKRKRQHHNGVDYAAPIGTSVFAAGDGVITKFYKSKSYGNYVRIEHSNGFSTAYAHLESFSKAVKSGHKVERGQVIGYVGNTGRSTGPHLHFELIHKGQFIDPLLFEKTAEKTAKKTADSPQLSESREAHTYSPILSSELVRVSVQ